MSTPRTIYAADLFCGAGGFSSGLLDVARSLGFEVDLLAVNHWEVAIATHSANHPGVRHLCQSLEAVNPREVVPSGRLDLLLASPECQHHSAARGGKPMSDQKRASAWCILRWLEALDVQNVVIENVPEFLTWGPLHPCKCGEEEKAIADGRPVAKVKHLPGFNCCRPVEAKKALYFKNFVRNMKVLGYRVDWRVCNAADYGAATTRKRLFLLARKGRRGITWPEATHVSRAKAVESQGDLFQDTRLPWRAAREIIDWTLEGKSIYDRERPLADNTMARIYAGLEKFCGLPFLVPQFSQNGPRSVDDPVGAITTTSRGMGLAEPLLVVLRQNADCRSLDDPAPAICAEGQHLGLAEPFIVPVNHGPELRGQALDEPLPTLTQKGTQALIQPEFLLGQQSCGAPRSVDEPAPTIAAAGAIALIEPHVEPCLVNMKGQSDASDVDEPAPTITAHAAHLYLAQPYVTDFNGPGKEHGHRCRSVDEPLPTLPCSRRVGVAEPFLVDSYSERPGQAPRCRSVDQPMPTIPATVQHGVAQPFVIRYHGTDHTAHSVENPLPAITTRDRYALVHPELVRSGQVQGVVVGRLDIRFRMLRPHELAAAMSFPADYQFTGNQEDRVRQIGNAVDVSMARALVRTVLT